MTKRFKHGASVTLTNGDALHYCGPHVVEIWSGRDSVRLSAEDVARIQAADLLEDVPEPKTPGQGVAAAWREEGCPLSDESAAWDRIAARLGIKPEGE